MKNWIMKYRRGAAYHELVVRSKFFPDMVFEMNGLSKEERRDMQLQVNEFMRLKGSLT